MDDVEREPSEADRPGHEDDDAPDARRDDAVEHMNALAREGGVAGSDDPGEGVGGSGGPSRVV